MTRKNSSRGKKAVASGQYGEDSFEGALLPYVPSINFKEFEHRGLYPGPYPDDMPWLAIRHYPVKNPFNQCGERNAENDSMIFGGERIFTQVKNQTSRGSVDEKVVAAFKIAQYTLTTTPFDRFLLVLLGIHWARKAELIKWAREVAAPKFVLDWKAFGGTVAVDIVHGPMELAKNLQSIMKGDLYETKS